jgi:predicted DNA-binding transcriptional regulator AlpA
MQHARINVPAGDSLIDIEQVKAQIGIGKTKLYAMEKAGDLPPHRKLGRASRWVKSEIDATVEAIKRGGTWKDVKGANDAE